MKKIRSPVRSWVPYWVLALSLLLTCLATYHLLATAHPREGASLVLVLGLLASAILFAVTRAQVRAVFRAEQTAADLRRSEEALRESGDRYRQLVELSPEAIFLQRDGRFEFVNSAMVGLLGASEAAELAGKPVADFIHPDSRERSAERGSLSRGERVAGALVEERWMRRYGSTVEVEAAASSLPDQGGPVTQVFLRDITSRKHTERQLREEAGITETLHSIGLATAAELDLRKLAQTIVDAATRITGAQFGGFFYHLVDERGEFFREHVLSGTPPEGIEELLRPRDPEVPTPIFRGEGVRRIDDVLDDSLFGRLSPPPEGRPARWPIRSYLTAPVVSRSGELLGGFFFGHPAPGIFSERVERILGGIAAQAAVAIDNARLYQAERRARAEAEAANQAKDRFMATLSHELRTPLAPVLAVLSGLELEDLPARVRERLSTIRRNVELEARLIDDLLDLTRITRGKLELKPEVADLRHILEHALDACCPRDSTDRLRFDLKVPAGDLRLWGDAPRLTQVFWNLLKNALKFTPDGGAIRVRARRDEETGQLVVEVSDAGIGIEPERLPRIFEAFEQGQRSITRQFGGLGLGLAISKAIVELHGGRIAAVSDGPGKGTTFKVLLPVGAARLPMAAVLPRPEPGQIPAAAADRPLSILLVEDHPDTAEAMADLLAAVGHRVTVANSAAEALTAAERAQQTVPRGGFDLVISDVGLPDVSGLELMVQLRSRFRLRGIALSGYGMDEDVERSREAGFDRHLTKPVNLQILRDAIRQVAGTP